MTRKKTISLAVILIAAMDIQGAYADHHRNGSQAVTLSWLFFNNPDECLSNSTAPEQCGEIDVFGEGYLEPVATGSPDPSLISPDRNARLAAVYSTGGITDTRGSIRLVASAYRSAPDVPLSLGPNVVDPLVLVRTDIPGAPPECLPLGHQPKL